MKSRYFELFYVPFHHLVDLEYFSILRNGRRFWETLYVRIYSTFFYSTMETVCMYNTGLPKKCNRFLKVWKLIFSNHFILSSSLDSSGFSSIKKKWKCLWETLYLYVLYGIKLMYLSNRANFFQTSPHRRLWTPNQQNNDIIDLF